MPIDDYMQQSSDNNGILFPRIDSKDLLEYACSAYRLQRKLIRKFNDHARIITDISDKIDSKYFIHHSDELLAAKSSSACILLLKSIRSSQRPVNNVQLQEYNFLCGPSPKNV
jgi:hypothetical protein